MTRYVRMDTRRDGYSQDQCGRTMTVRELIETLEEFDEDLPVFFSNDDGYTYGSLVEWCIEEDEYEEESDEEDEEEEEEED